MRYHRTEAAGASYFFTVVTFRRQPVFTEAPVVEMLERAIRRVQERRPFVVEAQVVLADHLHALWTLHEEDSDYPTRWRLIKEAFTREYVPAYGLIWHDHRRHARGGRTVWQRRYWEHLIRDDRDFSAHLEYIHLNPVRHGLVSAPRDWPHSTFLKWVANGSYDLTWGSKGPVSLPDWAGRE
jgi:REP-associated tyrosine transposase